MSLEKIKNHLQEYSYLKSIQSLLHWDMETMMPAGAIEDRASRLSYIQGKIHDHITGKRYQNLIDSFEGQKLSKLEKRLLKEMKWDLNLFKVVPKKHIMELSHAQTIATHNWGSAKKNNDWESFRPHLQKLIDLKKRETSYYSSKKPYDALLKLHDKEFDSKAINLLFSDLREGLIKLVNDVKKEGRFVNVKDLSGPFDVDAQRKVNLFITELFGLSDKYSRLDTSTHPFSINISPKDQRITTRYSENNLDSISSTMHEVGHALYELNLPAEWEGTPFQEAISLSVHESQSRFWENIIGRSKEFSHFIHPIMKKHFSENMKGVGPDQLFKIFNKSVPNLIRVESCELYYNLHVIIRYEIEEMIFNQGLNAKELPEVWSEKYHKYLGLKPKSNAEGVLQDSHWAGAAFGYFPTYTLGNLISGSLYQKMRKAVPTFKEDNLRGNYTQIRNYLIENIHSKGRSIDSHDIVGELKVNDYLSYLREKFLGA